MIFYYLSLDITPLDFFNFAITYLNYYHIGFLSIKYACLLPFNLPVTTISTSDIYNFRHLFYSPLHSPYTNT